MIQSNDLARYLPHKPVARSIGNGNAPEFPHKVQRPWQPCTRMPHQPLANAGLIFDAWIHSCAAVLQHWTYKQTWKETDTVRGHHTSHEQTEHIASAPRRCVRKKCGMSTEVASPLHWQPLKLPVCRKTLWPAMTVALPQSCYM